MDVFLYNGAIERGTDLDFIDFVSKNKSNDTLELIIVTPGGSPDAAYKIGKYIQSLYKKIIIYVPGFCKSAGTLLAISGDEIVFSPYGELGPLDVQMMRQDNIAGLESGLNISEAFISLERRARDTFHDLISEIVTGSGGVVSFHTASHSASEVVSALYGPIFARIDPEEVGSRARAMRIGEDYGKRLNGRFQNLKANALSMLSQTYSSHGFVIDREEASALFERVREANEVEKKLVETMGRACRFPNSGRRPQLENLTKKFEEIEQSLKVENPDGKGDDAKAVGSGSGARAPRASNGRDSSGASSA